MRRPLRAPACPLSWTHHPYARLAQVLHKAAGGPPAADFSGRLARRATQSCEDVLPGRDDTSHARPRFAGAAQRALPSCIPPSCPRACPKRPSASLLADYPPCGRLLERGRVPQTMDASVQRAGYVRGTLRARLVRVCVRGVSSCMRSVPCREWVSCGLQLTATVSQKFICISI